ncbi:MAG TPA: ATP-dependent DNA helicase [Steroidobacteraceae bacterium]|nr:ATP-dependent DNA helicase [Steroidobacteraceae bacterium]
MAVRIDAALHAREILLVEAGTGTGKTYAYLVPALLSGLRVLISTGTRTLQDQLFHRDLPLLSAAVGRPARVALLKGRSNYLCRARLADVGRQAELLPAVADSAAGIEADTPADAILARAQQWAQVTRSGDLAELPDFGEEHPLRGQLSSTRESCSGSHCSEFACCHVFAARRAALDADIVVVNHHLLLADMALKEDGFGDLLPSVDAVILDEAHQLPDLASEFFGVSLSARQIELLLADLVAALRAAGVGAREAAAVRGRLAAPLLRALQEARGAIGSGERQLAWRDLSVAALRGVRQLEDGLVQLHEQLAALSATQPALQPCAARAQAQAAALRQIIDEDTPGARTLWSDARGFGLRLLPYDISGRFRAFMDQGRAAWVFTSATLAVAQDFSHFASRLGLASAASLCLPSPFDYERQALLYLPAGLPQPAEARFTSALIEAALPLIEAAGGGAFVLFTSLRALRQAAVQLAPLLPDSLPLLIQGSAPRELLLRRFRASGNAVLLGSASFWEGVDVQGPALRLVIIDKLPFASPEDPVVRARIEHLQSQGANPFTDYQLPEAVLALKQGVGRLIRSEHDAGVVMIGDPRLTGRGYGRLFRASLPPMSVTHDAAAACARLAALAPALAPAPRQALPS